ncbi:MAG TPA: ABC transporter permease, partial [Spirochaetia bacterium]|nr:ABC transporter permease [Spirochaetia bacterium]
MIQGILIEGFIYGIMVLGVFITFRILDFPDLTVDGSFPLGAAVMAMMLIGGHSIILSFLVAFLAGFAAGMVTALIHNKLNVPNLLASILTMTMLYSVNIRILKNRANVPLLRVETIITKIVALNAGRLSDDVAILIFL